MQYGTLQGVPQLAAPSIVWIPTGDIYTDPSGMRLDQESQIVAGKQVSLYQVYKRSCGADLVISVDGGPDDDAYSKLEALIARTCLGLRDGPGNYNGQNAFPVSGRMLDREELSENTVGYVMQIVAEVPVIYEIPEYIAETLQITVTPESP